MLNEVKDLVFRVEVRFLPGKGLDKDLGVYAAVIP